MQADGQVSYDAWGPGMLTRCHGPVPIFGASHGQFRLDRNIVTSQPLNESGHCGRIQAVRSISLAAG